jgi:hypothetical protein
MQKNMIANGISFLRSSAGGMPALKRPMNPSFLLPAEPRLVTC